MFFVVVTARIDPARIYVMVVTCGDKEIGEC
jgi:hypothetical protein